MPLEETVFPQSLCGLPTHFKLLDPGASGFETAARRPPAPRIMDDPPRKSKSRALKIDTKSVHNRSKIDKRPPRGQKERPRWQFKAQKRRLPQYIP